MKTGYAMLSAIGCLFIATACSSEVVDRTWNQYRGELGTNTVEINDSTDSNDAFLRIVHVHPNDQPSYVSITGHAGRAIGRWERVFYCGMPSTGFGCNSVIFDHETNGWKFEACDGDKGNVKPFSDQQILFAIRQLDEAVAQTLNAEHLVYSWKNPSFKG